MPGQKDPVAPLQEERLTVHLELGRTLEQDDPLIMVLVVVDRLVGHGTENLLKNHVAHQNEPLDVLAARGSSGAGE